MQEQLENLAQIIIILNGLYKLYENYKGNKKSK